MSPHAVMERALEATPFAPTHGGVSIESVAIPTCGRPEALVRCLTSYIENTRRHGRTLQFVVADDSGSRSARQASRRTLRELAFRHGATVRYAGLEEKLVFAKAMIDTRRIPAEVVKFALFDVAGYRYTPGANRNALALDTAGTATLQVDDDSVCRTAFPPGGEPGLLVMPDRAFTPAHPCEFWIHPDRAAALAAAAPGDADVIGLHEEWLGLTFEAAVGSAHAAGPVEIHAPDAHFLRRAGSGHARICATVNGVLGDCGWPTPLFYLFLTGDSFARLVRSESDYRTAFTSREVFRVARRVTLVDGASSTGGFAAGLDQRRPLAPQFPVGRGQDVLHWKTLERSGDAGWIAHLPWALQHLPVEARSFPPGDALRPRMGVELFRLVVALLDGYTPCEPAYADDGKAALGRFLERWGRRSRGELEDVLRQHVLDVTAAQIAHLEERLDEERHAPAFWARDVRELITGMKDAYGARQAGLAPIDLLYAGGVTEAWERARSLLVDFGRLLQWWPEMTALAAELRSHGCRLAPELKDIA